MNGLRHADWAPSYSHEDGDLVELFFLPALACARVYQRVTGYFNKEALSLASRGLDSLIRNDGRMQLIVGCTLEQEEVDAIEAGYAIRTLIEKGIHKRLEQIFASEWERTQLGWLSWMIAHNYLDIKVAIPKDAEGRYRAGLGLYHAKAGLLVDEAGDKLAFRGSLNETFAGWKQNCESFDVSCSWRGEWDLLRVQRTESEFAKLWTNTARAAEVLDVPDAIRQQLLQFLPKEDIIVTLPPPAAEVPCAEVPEEVPSVDETPQELVPDEPMLSSMDRARGVWSFLKFAAHREDGAMVAVKTSAVDPWPHQLRAYKRMLDSWPFRLLIADEVGLGKTIEAGLIIRHAWISGLAQRILIMTPKGILRQWQSELYEKFNLLVPIYTGQTLVWPEHHFRRISIEDKVERKQWTEQPIVLTSSHLMRRRERQDELVNAADWDLLVLDEAHHARRHGAGTPQEKGPNHLLRLMLKIREKAKSLLLLTATPMQVHPVEIWDLLSLLGLPREWSDKAFVDYFERAGGNPDVEGLRQMAALFQATEREYGPVPDTELARIFESLGLGPIDRKRVLNALHETNSTIPFRQLSTPQRKAALAVLRVVSPIRHRMSRHTRNLLREYGRNGLLETPIAERDVADIEIEMTLGERALYEAVEDYISEVYAKADVKKKTAVGFVMTIYRRRLSSSFNALRKTLESRLTRLDGPNIQGADELLIEEDAAPDEQVDDVMGAEDALELTEEAREFEERERIQALLKGIVKLGTDSKARRLVEVLRTALDSDSDSAIVFTQYTDTMEYLKDFVADRLDLPIGCYSGSGGQRRDLAGAWTKCSKEEIRRLLREQHIKLLICTDAAAEGLNLQSCGILVNYDLPWNPMKVEQRIGRIDRIGQRHPVIRVINLGYANTVETDVYFALSRRIGLFKGVVGKLQPILSHVPRAFEVAVLSRQRDKARADAVSRVESLVSEAEEAAFDIDQVSEADLAPPAMPSPPFLPEDVDVVLRDVSLLPAGVECSALEPGTYALRVPGEKDSARVTALPQVFDEHFESHQLILPGSPLFERLACLAGADFESSPIAPELFKALAFPSCD